MKMQQDDGPLYLYVFDGQGKHTGKTELATADACAEVIERAIKERQTVTITDLRDFCVFRCERGRVVWPRAEKLFEKTG